MNLLRKVSRKIENLLTKRAVVLSYHRIIQAHFDPFNLNVSPENFEQQLDVLKNRYNVVPVSEFLDCFNEGAFPEKTVCLTFDDGYKDNFVLARPLLEKYNLPACFFVPTFYLNKQQPFWWDELAEILFTSTSLPETLSLDIRGRVVAFAIDDCRTITNEQIEALKRWKRRDANANTRIAAYLQLSKLLLPLSFEEIQVVLHQLRAQSNYKARIDPMNLSMSKADLKELAGNPLFEIGLHTVTHTALGFHDKSQQHKEIRENKRQLEKIVRVPVNTIAYPNGSYNSTTIDVLREQQVVAAFTTRQDKITKYSDTYQLSRYKANNWSGLQFKKKLDEWFTN